ncbi:MAG: AAA family ATPase [Phycisphaerae bacterium]
MGNLLQVCLYNREAEASEDLKAALQGLNFVRLVAAVDDPETLAQAIQETEVNLVFFHLDPDPGPVVEVIDQVSTRYPEVALIAVSHNTGPDAILAPMRAGCDQFVCEPIDPADLATAVGRVASKRLLSQPKSRCVCVTGASGGSGVTSIACNLALEIGQLSDRDCALVDLDLQFGDIALNFDCEPKYNLYDLAVAGSELDEAILSSAVNKLACKVAILSRPEQLDQLEAITPDTIHRVMDLLKAQYENIVIDTARFITPTLAAAFSHADVVMIVCQLLVPSVRNAKRYYDALQQLGIPEERLELVVNRGDGRSGRLTIKDIEDTIQKPVFACIPNDYQFVARSIDFGRPVASLDQGSPVRTAIRKVAQKVATGAGSENRGKQDRRGFLGRLLTK